HVTHRFVDEYNKKWSVYTALEDTVRGTGGALTGSVLTDVSGIGILVIAVTPVVKQFGILMGISILYSYLASIIVLPPFLILWQRYFD
ncbi:MAG: MMPL family transporter, partial [Halobacteria archaeon]|nr:MMPL family transporter [Halobacteria archaeon]